MSKSIKLVIAIVIVAAIAMGAVLLAGKEPENTAPGSTATNATESSRPTPATATIAYDDDGFSPSTLTVSSGDTVKFVNNSDEEIKPSSGPHPVHTNNPQLNIGDIEPGQSKTVTLTTKGTWSYHNHYNEDKGGELTVE